MTTAIKRRRGTTAQHATFTGLEGELTVDTTKDTVVVHDGATAGGFPLAKESQATTNVAITGGTITGITDIAIADGGTGASTAADARTNLGVTATGADTTYAYRANNLSDLASASTARSNLGLGTIATQAASSVAVTGGTIDGATIGGTTAGAGTFTNLAYTGTLTGGTGVVNLGSGQFYKDASGNVGIGTTTLTNALTVSRGSGVVAGLDLMSNANTTSTAFFVGQGSSNQGFLYNRANEGLYFGTNNTERMRIDSSGNVGIGTSSPSQALQIGSTSKASDSIVYAASASGAYKTGFVYEGSGGAYGFIGYNKTGSTYLGIPDSTVGFSQGGGSNPMVFATNATERMRIDSSGNVGIGTDPTYQTPQKRLEVFENNSTTTTTTGLLVTNFSTTNNSRAGVVFRNFDNYGSAIWSPRTGSTAGELVFGTKTDVGIAETNITERMRIDSSGNVLVGTTTGDYHRFKKDVPGIIFQVENLYGSTSQTYRSSMATAAADTASYHFVGNCQANGDRVYIYGNGNIVNSNNSYGALSDRVIKENIVDASPKLDALMQVKVRNYNLIADETKAKQIGVVAQELEEVFPSMIEIDGMSGHKQVKYSVFVPMLIKAIQELKAELDVVKAELNTLKGN